MRSGLVVGAVAVFVVGLGAFFALRGGSEQRSEPSARGDGAESLRLELDRNKRALASCRDDVDDLEKELDELRRAQGLAPVGHKNAARSGDDVEVATNRSRAREPAAGPNDARTTQWIDHVTGDLALTDRQRAQLVDIAKWTADQRNALKARAEQEQLDSNAVRAEIANQRAEYEAKMKALLTAEEWQAFDQTQGIDRRPPTFSRMPDILGDQGQPIGVDAGYPTDSVVDAGFYDAGNPGQKLGPQTGGNTGTQNGQARQSSQPSSSSAGSNRPTSDDSHRSGR
jgi:hypothetical protein